MRDYHQIWHKESPEPFLQKREEIFLERPSYRLQASFESSGNSDISFHSHYQGSEIFNLNTLQTFLVDILHLVFISSPQTASTTLTAVTCLDS